MRKKLLSIAAAALCIAVGHSAVAGYGIIPSETTISRLSSRAEVVVRARLTAVAETPVSGINPDVNLYRYNNGNDSVRRDLQLDVTRVIRGEGVEAGPLPVVSIRQYAMSQYPLSLQSGGEGIFFLYRRAGDGLWEVLGEARGLLTSEDAAGDLAKAEYALDSYVSLTAELEPAQLPPVMQHVLLNDVKAGLGRVAVDAAIEFGWHWDSYVSHFDDLEKDDLLRAMVASERGSEFRRELITAVGRVLPTGGDRSLVDMIASDSSTSVASLGSWALEQYGRASSSAMLVDKYVTLAAGDVTGRARVMQALGIMRPRDNDQERAQRERFTDILRGALAARTPGSEVTEEALLAARDMRYTGDELGTELRQIVSDFRTGKLADEAIFRRAIVALAATRNTAAREYLLSLRGDFAGRFDKHIELSMMMPFTVLVDGK